MDSKCERILIFKSLLPLKIQINSKKTRFWKGKSVEDVITLRPMAEATLVSMNIPPSKEKESLLLGSLREWEGPYPLSMSIRVRFLGPLLWNMLSSFSFVKQRPSKEP